MKHILKARQDSGESTKHKWAEEALRLSEGKLNAMLESIPDRMSMMDKDLNIIWANKTAKIIFGNDIIGKKCYEVYHKRKEPCEPYPCLTLKAFQDGKIHEHDTQVIDENGKILYFHCTANVALRDKNGKPSAVIAISRDISERKQAEQAVRESEERYRTLTEFANDCIAVSQGGKTIYCNRAYERLIGYSVEETSNRLSIDLIVPEDRDRIAVYHKRILEGKDIPDQYELEILAKNGRRIALGCKASLIEYQGHPAIMAVMRDITERKREEKEKRQLENQLFRSQKIHAIGTFASGIAHDFNNIIGAIIANAEMALGDIPEEAPGRRELERIVRAGSRAKDLVKRILTYSRKGQKELKPFQVGEVVKEALKLLRPSLPENIEVRQDIATGSDLVLGDPTEIYQVLMNLCANAVEAMHKKGGMLEVNLTDVNFTSDKLPFTDMKPGSYFRITVSDTGHGMSRAGLERIFDLHYTTKGTGRGLGLQVVQRILKNYGGAITVASEVGRGTTFQVFFQKIDIRIIPEEMSVGPLTVGVEKILFVDDYKEIVDAMPLLLQRLGYKVVAKTNSLEALEIFRSQPDKFDLIITDQTMPHMTGVNLAKEAFKIRPDIPVILYTGFSDKTTLKKAKDIGIREIIFKPISIRDMAETIRRVLDREEAYGKYPDY